MATAVMVLAKVWNNPDDGVGVLPKEHVQSVKAILKNIFVKYRIVKDHVET